MDETLIGETPVTITNQDERKLHDAMARAEKGLIRAITWGAPEPVVAAYERRCASRFAAWKRACQR